MKKTYLAIVLLGIVLTISFIIVNVYSRHPLNIDISTPVRIDVRPDYPMRYYAEDVHGARINILQAPIDIEKYRGKSVLIHGSARVSDGKSTLCTPKFQKTCKDYAAGYGLVITKIIP